MGPSSHSHLARLLGQLREATPEQLEAIERILAGQAVPERLRPKHPRYALRREGSLWQLTFDYGDAILRHEQGICYVAATLSRPREGVKKLDLAAKYSSPRAKGGDGIEVYNPTTGEYEPPDSMEPVHEAALAADDDEARRAYQARARELKETLDDPTETEGAKVEAREELEGIAAHLRRDSRTHRDPTKAAADGVRNGINRFLRNLVGRGDTASSPLPVRRGFAEHLERYLLMPSGRYARPRARKARGELTGCPALRPARRNSLGGQPVIGLPTLQLL
jgi:hypothetical protein